ncbi:MAG: 1-deoxy-D-xylulose-5-phosphate reductoisomerase [Flavobacteriales bacterium]|nr:1-deoxy-D-xylulose-5-phosphate reductoisomerase [Flavobacteriales bacterium]MBK6893018.1 1-deoxy-D-xylulose-5-phosphate reductoisomerase [Flavobacteriales bacterium]MBK7249261.1 1-deoxy-D-xylulose-5-phosphate reductoisomerase [Flavobacteriales bacterium]MBK9599714.1 1-deoxy-D-xylulose-5-phosphate reductoisomerase [Flavobacteriales bacterium]QQS71479.1 MAG: 1-deoxy-D-xylulose-5-phosphate reductoisomerase [Flavobacteriales bacterium]
MPEEISPKRIAILGSTGSIGTQALEVVREQSAHFTVELLTARKNAELLIAQAKEFNPNAVVIGDESRYAEVRDALFPLGVKVFAGADAIAQAVQMETIDTVLTAMVGYAGMRPTLAAIDAGKAIALANKETLVVAGELVTKRAQANAVNIYPVDSEHSAIFQCLAGEWENPIEKIVLTASGGPFRGKTKAELAAVTKAQALKHPNWDMGAKITIDSASLMNKGLEAIEAKWLFNLKPEQVEIIVHPQSIIHSLVQFRDGSMKAQLGLPDMKLPIQYALAYPERLTTTWPRFDFSKYPSFTFEQPDLQAFPNLGLALEAMKRGGNAPCVLNAANEVAVEAFLQERIGFLEMSDMIRDRLAKATFVASPTLEDLEASDAETRRAAHETLNSPQWRS